MKTEEKVKCFPSPTFLICRNVVIKTDEDNQYISTDQESNVDAFLTKKIESYSWAGAVAMNHRDEPPPGEDTRCHRRKVGKVLFSGGSAPYGCKTKYLIQFPPLWYLMKINEANKIPDICDIFIRFFY